MSSPKSQKGSLATEGLNVVDVKGGPASVTRLHPFDPAQPAAFRPRATVQRFA